MNSRIDHHQPQFKDVLGQFSSSYHLEMLLDHQRTQPIFAALERVIGPDTIFCELGCGTGIFSIFAARKAKKVYAVEMDPKMIEVAKENIEKSGVRNKLELIEGNALDVTLPTKANVILCEMMSTWCVEEPQIPVFNRAKKDLLESDGIFLPQRIVNLAELCFFEYSYHGITLKASTPIFTGTPKPHRMSESRVCQALDFTVQLLINNDINVEVKAIAAGIVNSVCLHSIVQYIPGIVFSGSDSLMPSTLVPTQNELEVNFDDRLLLSGSYQARSSIQDMSFQVTKISD